MKRHELLKAGIDCIQSGDVGTMQLLLSQEMPGAEGGLMRRQIIHAIEAGDINRAAGLWTAAVARYRFGVLAAYKFAKLLMTAALAGGMIGGLLYLFDKLLK